MKASSLAVSDSIFREADRHILPSSDQNNLSCDSPRSKLDFILILGPCYNSSLLYVMREIAFEALLLIVKLSGRGEPDPRASFDG